MDKKIDITYIKGDLFTTFVSASPQGDKLMSQMMAQNGGSNKVPTAQADKVIAQIRARGYTVRKAKPISKEETDAIFAELKKE